MLIKQKTQFCVSASYRTKKPIEHETCSKKPTGCFQKSGGNPPQWMVKNNGTTPIKNGWFGVEKSHDFRNHPTTPPQRGPHLACHGAPGIPFGHRCLKVEKRRVQGAPKGTPICRFRILAFEQRLITMRLLITILLTLVWCGALSYSYDFETRLVKR